MSCQFVPTVTISLTQYEGLTQAMNEKFKLMEDIDLWMERYAEAKKELDTKTKELQDLRDWLGERYDAD